MDDEPNWEHEALRQKAYADKFYDENCDLRLLLSRCRTILANMAMEREGAIFFRWPINHEPLRNDARNLLPELDKALNS